MPELLQHIRGAGLLIVPEIILLLGVCVLFLVGPMLVTDAGEAPAGLRKGWGLFSLVTLIVAGAAWWQLGLQPAEHGLFQSDALLWYVRGLTLVGGGLLALVLWNQIDDGHSAEAYACLLSIIAGTSLVAAANDLVTLFLALELVSIPTYVILYLGRRDRIGGEATLKYFLLSIFSSALVLYGMSWVYGVAGSTNFGAIRVVLENRNPHAGEGMLELAFALLLAGLCFRIAAVPFHFYAPDVFQGTTASNAALLSLIPKIVGFVALMRVIPLSGATVGGPQWLLETDAKQLVALIAVVTMFVGNLMALRQKHLFRLMAYSSIAHAGYMLIGLAVGDLLPVGGRQAILFYLATYGLMTIGVFALLIAGGDGDRALQTDDDVRGLSRAKPIVALMLAICLFSLTGLPPTAGFLGKLYLFFAAWGEDTHIGHGLAICLAINAAISAYYYLRLVALMFLEPATRPASLHAPVAWASWFAGVACAVATIALFVTPQWLWDSIH
ncbi:MAG TPA: NADH-quinone oxidoreductase subunit N [Lacipirellulaceae bacterium]|nr:NADH-quinone oxidoreductase subunit N [Lacipirellulaceae bacterium]